MTIYHCNIHMILVIFSEIEYKNQSPTGIRIEKDDFIWPDM